jgi:DNA-binding NarL/FixJ family response regulator
VLENLSKPINDTDLTECYLVVEDEVHYSAWLEESLKLARPSSEVIIGSSRAACEHLLANYVPAWAFVDLHLPDASGIEVVKDILLVAPHCKVLVITAIEDPEKAILAIQAGAAGYLVKSHSNWVLAEALDEIDRGGMPLTPLMAKRVLETLLPQRANTVPADTADSLTDREREILTMATRGYRNKEIAVRLDLSPNTVATHIKAIYRKMNIHSRSHLRRAASE